MQTARLNPRQSKFLRLYTGRNADYFGNATACYKAVYGVTSDRIAQVSGSRLLAHPRIAPILAQAEQAAIDRLNINAEFVLNESVRLYDRAMGDEPVTVEQSSIDKATGLETLTVTETRRYDPGTARQALEMIGRHKNVQAFQDNVEHTHTHYLEAALMKRSKVIEGRAQVLLDNPAPAAAHPDPDIALALDCDPVPSASGPSGSTGQPQAVKEKRSLLPEVKRHHAKDERDPASERGGATAL